MIKFLDLLGGPGTGKGTQCGRLTKEFGFKHLSVGDLLRDEVKKGTRTGKQCAELMKEGKLVPVKISLGLLKNAMKESNSQKGYLIDGFPRACNQARAFEKQVLVDSLLKENVVNWNCIQFNPLHMLTNFGCFFARPGRGEGLQCALMAVLFYFCVDPSIPDNGKTTNETG